MKGDEPHEETGFGVCLFFILKHKYQIWGQKGNMLCKGALSISFTHAGQVEGVTSPAAHSWHFSAQLNGHLCIFVNSDVA